ncbi:MAG TPA: MerR family transcriptional regulator [Acetobacteraceae bacterium]|nr:MerR family transcriptional regulator [Acetobacteraceae bacterium]
MLTSKEIIERTGISRATLNNYIASGLVARPEVLPPGPEHGDAPRIGYFPDDTIARIQAIQRMKRDGWTMARIAEHFAKGGTAAPTQLPARPDAPVHAPPSPEPRPPRGPSLQSMAIAVATLQDAAGLWARLSAQEYFELANEVWTELEAIFLSHRGVLGRHPDEGLVCYFLREPGDRHLAGALAAAQAARRAMRGIDRRWQERKRWDVRVAMNFGIDEGEAWMGAIGADERRVLGDPADRAIQLSSCAEGGAILVTRSFVGKLAADAGQALSFAAPRLAGAAGPRPMNTFAPLAGICPAVPARLADVPVAEVLDPQNPTSA